MEVKIPKNLPQFRQAPALFMSCGDYEARLYLAFKGKLVREERIHMPPRREAREKQHFFDRYDRETFGGASHVDPYLEDLKKKFQKKVHASAHRIIADGKPKIIFIYAPRHAMNMILAGLEKSELDKVKVKFFGQYSKIHPLKMVEMFWEKMDMLIRAFAAPPLSDEGKKIMKRPKVKYSLRYRL